MSYRRLNQFTAEPRRWAGEMALQVKYLSCKGYLPSTELWNIAAGISNPKSPTLRWRTEAEASPEAHGVVSMVYTEANHKRHCLKKNGNTESYPLTSEWVSRHMWHRVRGGGMQGMNQKCFLMPENSWVSEQDFTLFHFSSEESSNLIISYVLKGAELSLQSWRRRAPLIGSQLFSPEIIT